MTDESTNEPLPWDAEQIAEHIANGDRVSGQPGGRWAPNKASRL